MSGRFLLEAGVGTRTADNCETPSLSCRFRVLPVQACSQQSLPRSTLDNLPQAPRDKVLRVSRMAGKHRCHPGAHKYELCNLLYIAVTVQCEKTSPVRKSRQRETPTTPMICMKMKNISPNAVALFDRWLIQVQYRHSFTDPWRQFSWRQGWPSCPYHSCSK